MGCRGGVPLLAEESGFCCLLTVKQRLGAMGQFEGEAANWLPNGVHAILPPLSGHSPPSHLFHRPLPAPSFHSGHMETRPRKPKGKLRLGKGERLPMMASKWWELGSNSWLLPHPRSPSGSGIDGFCHSPSTSLGS